jgi:hypothetical protein
MVQENLSDDHKLVRKQDCFGILQKTEDDENFLNTAVTCD